MTESRNLEQQQRTDAELDAELELHAETLHDLDAPEDGAEEIRGGKCWAAGLYTAPSLPA